MIINVDAILEFTGITYVDSLGLYMQLMKWSDIAGDGYGMIQIILPGAQQMVKHSCPW